ncbi:hypothetical protein [Azospirillum sp.]|uniref:hypothetical protein n=1 Tax=Azospirillum sp. TaxID=34012 RepID=UPI00261A0BEF|nr:hypothetical protein [Azospirillum sp.]
MRDAASKSNARATGARPRLKVRSLSFFDVLSVGVASVRISEPMGLRAFGNPNGDAARARMSSQKRSEKLDGWNFQIETAVAFCEPSWV